MTVEEELAGKSRAELLEIVKDHSPYMSNRESALRDGAVKILSRSLKAPTQETGKGWYYRESDKPCTTELDRKILDPTAADRGPTALCPVCNQEWRQHTYVNWDAAAEMDW